MINRLTADEVAQKIDISKNMIILEALPEKYFQKGHLPNALNLPHDVDESEIRSLLPDQHAQIITYCANGPCANSEILAERLIALGYENVFDFYDGKEGWVKSGRHLVK